MWIINFKMKDDKEHLLSRQGTELEAKKFIEGYIAAIVNHTEVVSKEEIDALPKMFDIRRMDDPKEE